MDDQEIKTAECHFLSILIERAPHLAAHANAALELDGTMGLMLRAAMEAGHLTARGVFPQRIDHRQLELFVVRGEREVEA